MLGFLTSVPFWGYLVIASWPAPHQESPFLFFHVLRILPLKFFRIILQQMNYSLQMGGIEGSSRVECKKVLDPRIKIPLYTCAESLKKKPMETLEFSSTQCHNTLLAFVTTWECLRRSENENMKEPSSIIVHSNSSHVKRVLMEEPVHSARYRLRFLHN